ncbi:MAG: chemotaxis protein CheB, partial [Bryobacteraceae bacterium]|nr:chemotaxis protein CheB [Bryobacteraceae bacterium]
AAARQHSTPAKPVNAAPAAAPSPQRFKNSMLLAIGASTGGTVAIEQVLTQCPVETPPIVIAQHIPAGFSAAFAERLNKVCAIEVREARDGDVARTGLALVAPGNRHMRVRNTASNGWVIQLDDGPKVCYQRPSVDVLFQSVAEQAGRNAAGAILTGMGSDGADGLLAMRRAGAGTIAQDEATCVVFGMPREAILRGGAAQTLPLARIARALLDACRLPG